VRERQLKIPIKSLFSIYHIQKFIHFSR